MNQGKLEVIKQEMARVNIKILGITDLKWIGMGKTICLIKNDRMISLHFQGQPFSITVMQVYAPTSNAEKAEAEWFYEDLQDLLDLTPRKDVLFIIGDWNEKVGSQEIPGVTGKLPLEYKMKQVKG